MPPTPEENYAAGLNTVQLFGRIVGEIVAGRTAAGTPCANLTLITEATWRGTDGKLKAASTRHPIALFGRTAEFVAARCRPGQHLFVSGRNTPRRGPGGQQIYSVTGAFVNLAEPAGGPDA